MNGIKFDGGKAAMELLPPLAAKIVAWVLTYGAEKYERDNWRRVDDAKRRYMGSCLRHIFAHMSGEIMDQDPLVEGVALPHLACAASCLQFILQLMAEDGEIPINYDLRGVREAYAPAREEYRRRVAENVTGESLKAMDLGEPTA